MDEITLKLTRLLCELLLVDEAMVSPRAKLTDDLGADSLDRIQLMMDIEEAFNIEVPEEVIDSITTVEDLVGYVSSRMVAG